LYCSMAQSAFCLFSALSPPGTYCEKHAVARYSLATANSGSRLMAFLKKFSACSKRLALYAWTPLLSWSRARSLVHPVVASIIAIRPMATAALPRLLPKHFHVHVCAFALFVIRLL